jgi:hypothetical protein
MIQAIEKIKELLEEPVDNSSTMQMTDLASRLTSIQGLSSLLVSESLKELRKAELIALEDNQHLYSKASILSKIINAKTAEEQATHELCKMLNKAIITKIEYIRTAISLYKAEWLTSKGDNLGNL